MILIYRLCTRNNSKKERPIYGDDKAKFLFFCYGSILRAFPNTSFMHFIVDGPTVGTRYMVDQCPFEHDVVFYNNYGVHPGVGNAVTFANSLDLAMKHPKEKVVLIEDDYYFLEGAGKHLEDVLDEVEVVTPYDHTAYYTDRRYAPGQKQLFSGYMWQEVHSTCLTFACKGEFIARERECMDRYGTIDADMWADLTQRTMLWAPIPTLSTHMEPEFLSRGVDWDAEFKKAVPFYPHS